MTPISRGPLAIPLPSIGELLAWLTQLAPLELAEPWDNVGLLLGNAGRKTDRVLTCLTLTADVVEEALANGVQLVITHHPLPFKPCHRLVATDSVGGRVLSLAEGGVAVVSLHTAFDSAAQGINAQWAGQLRLQAVAPLKPAPAIAMATAEKGILGSGRCGLLEPPCTLAELAALAKNLVGAPWVEFSGNPQGLVRRVGIACGSGGELIAAARAAECQALITGEARFHAILEAQDLELGLIQVGHFFSERFAMDWLAHQVSAHFPGVLAWGSRVEKDPRTLLAG